MISLPSELIIDLCHKMCTYSTIDNRNLDNFSASCRYVYDIMRNNQEKIIPFYLYKRKTADTTVYKFGNLLHNINDQPALTTYIGGKYWYQRGKLHRASDRPAVIRHPICFGVVNFGTVVREWWYQGCRHRNGGPAVDWGNGNVEFWIDGECRK